MEQQLSKYFQRVHRMSYLNSKSFRSPQMEYVKMSNRCAKQAMIISLLKTDQREQKIPKGTKQGSADFYKKGQSNNHSAA